MDFESKARDSEMKDCWGRVVFTTVDDLYEKGVTDIINRFGRELLHVNRGCDRGYFCLHQDEEQKDGVYETCLEFVLNGENDIDGVKQAVNRVTAVSESCYKVCHHGIWQICANSGYGATTLTRTNGVVRTDNAKSIADVVEIRKHMYKYLKHVGMSHEELVAKMKEDRIEFVNDSADEMREYIIEWNPVKRALSELQSQNDALEETLGWIFQSLSFPSKL